MALVTCTIAKAQPANLDDLQRQLDRDKQQKAAQQSPAPAKKSDNPKPAPAGPGRQATLVVETDAACELRIDGKRRASLKAKDAVVLTVDAGKLLVVCASTEVTEALSVEFRDVVDVQSGTKEVLQIELKRAVSESQRRNEAQVAAEAERRAKLQAEATAQAARRARWSAEPGDTLRDRNSGLTWTRSDYGTSIDWYKARDWCTGKGSGWALPTVAQLASLRDEPVGERCCRVGGPFELKGSWYWTGVAVNATQFRIVHLGVPDGDSHVSFTGFSALVNALCVRGS